jgi:hypothetical protein
MTENWHQIYTKTFKNSTIRKCTTLFKVEKDLKTYFTKDVQIENTYMKRYSTSHVIWELKKELPVYTNYNAEI